MMLFMEPMLINVISVVEKEGNFRARARAGLITRDIENAYLAFDQLGLFAARRSGGEGLTKGGLYLLFADKSGKFRGRLPLLHGHCC
jgi:hypothetical protein